MSSLSYVGETIYYLPGHGGRITNGLGQTLVARGYEVVGRKKVGDFKKLDFNAQVTTIANDTKKHFWRKDASTLFKTISQTKSELSGQKRGYDR